MKMYAKIKERLVSYGPTLNASKDCRIRTDNGDEQSELKLSVRIFLNYR